MSDSEEPSDHENDQSIGGETNVPANLLQSQNISSLQSPRGGGIFSKSSILKGVHINSGSIKENTDLIEAN